MSIAPQPHVMMMGRPKENLLHLADALDRLDGDHMERVAGTTFTWFFGVFLDAYNSLRVLLNAPEKVQRKATCGSVGCAMGYANLVFRAKQEFEVSDEKGSDNMFWREMLGLNRREFDLLFAGDIKEYLIFSVHKYPSFDDCPDIGEIMPSDVSAAIRYFVHEKYRQGDA